MTAWISHSICHPCNKNSFKELVCGVSPHATSPFCFGKSDQNHFRPCAALRVNSTPAPNYMAAQLAPLKQCSPNSRIRPRGSAEPEGVKKLKKQIRFSNCGCGRQTLLKLKPHSRAHFLPPTAVQATTIPNSSCGALASPEPSARAFTCITPPMKFSPSFNPSNEP